MKDIAFLIPIYPPHYKFARDLIKSWQDCFLDEQSDLFFVFTNNAEKNEFEKWDNSIILPENLVNFENNGMINIKKFYGLTQIKDKYEYIIVLDAESKFIKNINLKEICQTYFKNKILYGNSQPPEGIGRTENIKSSCRRFFAGHKDFDKINTPLYLWFNQLCMYKSSTLDEFFDVIKYYDNPARFVWADFDYYIYMFYLILYQDFKVEDIDIVSNYGICEAGIDFLLFKSNKYEKINIYMCSQAVFKRFNNANLFVLIHLDRDERWMLSVLGLQVDDLIQRVKHSLVENQHLHEEIHNLYDEYQKFKNEFNIYKKKNKISYKIKKIICCFIPFKKLRKKIRGEL